MPHRVKLSEVYGVAVVQYTGHVDAHEIQQAYTEIATHPEFRPQLVAISDFRNADLDLSGEDVRGLAALARAVAPAWGETKWLAIVGTDAAFGLLRMFMSLTDSSSISVLVVRDPDEADAWLGLGSGLRGVLDDLFGVNADGAATPAG